MWPVGLDFDTCVLAVAEGQSSVDWHAVHFQCFEGGPGEGFIKAVEARLVIL